MDDIGVLLVCARALPRIGLKAILGQCADIKILDEVATFDAAVRRARQLTPDVILVDAGGEDFDLPGYVHTVLRGYGLPSCILIVAESPSDTVWKALRAGAGGFLLERNTPAHLIPALRMIAMGYVLIAAGAVPVHPAEGLAELTEPSDGAVKALTNREADILGLVARGWSNSDISQALDLAESTVKSHIGSVFVKLGLRNRVHAVIYAYEVGLVRANGGHPGQDAQYPQPGSAPVRAVG